MHLDNRMESSCWIQMGCNQYIFVFFCLSIAGIDITKHLTWSGTTRKKQPRIMCVDLGHRILIRNAGTLDLPGENYQLHLRLGTLHLSVYARISKIQARINSVIWKTTTTCNKNVMQKFSCACDYMILDLLLCVSTTYSQHGGQIDRGTLSEPWVMLE